MMKELYSRTEDCLELYKILKRKMGTKVECYGNPHTELFSGKYFSYYKSYRSDFDYLFDRGLPFYYKYRKNGFFRIQIGDDLPKNTSLGEKLAALSDFYGVLKEEFGEPTAFYTIKDDDEGLISLHWSFVNKEEDVKRFKEGTFFDDIETDELIIFGEPIEEKGYQLSDATKKMSAERIGLPFELLTLVDQNLEDYVKFKNGEKPSVPEGARIDATPVVSYERKLQNKKTLN